MQAGEFDPSNRGCLPDLRQCDCQVIPDSLVRTFDDVLLTMVRIQMLEVTP
ncbi:MAG: hypothetical protein Fues2KO_41480 [Fuerstiella sp.]